MRLKFALLAAAAVIVPPTLGLAQTAPTQAAPAPAAPAQSAPAKPSDAPTAVEGVVIRSDATAMRTDIDRRSYSVANDLSAKTGSISDALRNIPSVEVDVQGNVSLRGDSNVTILIDGKPSGMFNGDNRADALQSLPLADGRFSATRCALVELMPLTGRRHQLRRHLKHIAHPILGDATHGKGPLNRAVAALLGLQRLWLHALRLELEHPATGQRLCIETAPGDEWALWRPFGQATDG